MMKYAAVQHVIYNQEARGVSSAFSFPFEALLFSAHTCEEEIKSV
jgi:hypothetical protein